MPPKLLWTLFALALASSTNAFGFNFDSSSSSSSEESAEIDTVNVNDVKFERIARNDVKFDVLIFTQHWPVTVCYSWKKTSKHHECLLPSPKEIWTIHGIWPTQYGTMGPFYCDKSKPFNMTQLTPIESQLEQFWINIEKGTPEEGLWKHEWEKHGTCAAAIINELDNENKYFGQGLSWLNKYSMSSILTQSNITAGSEYSVVQIHKAIKKGLNINPVIECIFNSKTNDQYLFELRICFNKTLSLIDCDGVVGNYKESNGGGLVVDYLNGQLITNCDLNKPITYPSLMPQMQTESVKSKPNRFLSFVQYYKLVQFLKWITL